jgi:hypothetical protein
MGGLQQQSVLLKGQDVLADQRSEPGTGQARPVYVPPIDRAPLSYPQSDSSSSESGDPCGAAQKGLLT